GVPLRDDHDAGGVADRARPAPARRPGRRCERVAALLARHHAAPARRGAGDRAAAPRDQPQQLHHSLDHDRRGARGRVGDLDHARLPARLRPHPLRARLGLLGDPVRGDDDDGLVLRPRPHARRRAASGMSTAGPVAAPARRWRLEPWTLGGALLLVLLLLFSMLPMTWMLTTSLKTQFAAAQYPPEWI